jgi:alpha-D-xyloside xylohydrolase
VVILVREGAVLPHVKVAQSTGDIDWSRIELRSFAGGTSAKVQLFLPGEESVKELVLVKKGSKYVVSSDPFGGKVKWEIR